MPHEAESHQQNSFVSGFTLGLFAGAAGYFLFATKKGAVLRKQLLADWEDAKHHLAKEGVIQKSDISLRELFKDLINQATSQGKSSAQPNSSAHAAKATKLPTRKKDTGKRFRGV